MITNISVPLACPKCKCSLQVIKIGFFKPQDHYNCKTCHYTKRVEGFKRELLTV